MDSNQNNKGQLKQSSSCDALSLPSGISLSAPVVPVPQNYDATTAIMQITTSSSSNVTEDDAVDKSFQQGNNNNGNAHLISCSSRNSRPNSWKEAWSSNIQEFTDHWHDFFTDIYKNEENSVLDVILLSVELPFTIARKVCVCLFVCGCE